MDTSKRAAQLLKSREHFATEIPLIERGTEAAEGGCGVLGLASSIGIAGRHVLTASRQMHNRGNGKGGGIAMAGLDPDEMRVDVATLRSHTLLQVAYLDEDVRPEVEAAFIRPHFDIAQEYEVPHIENFQTIDGLEVQPPAVWRYFVRVKPDALAAFAANRGLSLLSPRDLEDEFVYQNSFALNQAFYASLGEKRSFVLSHGRDLIVLKIVGYAEQVVEYYQLQDQHAHVWIAHQRYPTKGRVWHPGGAHPFIGLNEALVHNGDFANYHAVSEYLHQRNMSPQFLTDTEVAVQLFDLWDRVYRYPLEVTLEAMAPTTEHDFAMLPKEKQELYRLVQATHIHGSPDGPWFFIVARSQPDEEQWELLGITDTSMLRPQVFALYENADDPGEAPVQIGLIASERQAINACLKSLSAEDERFQARADKYWVARGGSHTDGGSFRFAYSSAEGLVCSNKFGEPVVLPSGKQHARRSAVNPGHAAPDFCDTFQTMALRAFDDGGSSTFTRWCEPQIASASWNDVAWGLSWLTTFSQGGDDEWQFGNEVFTTLRDRPPNLGNKKKASFLSMVDDSLSRLFDGTPEIGSNAETFMKRYRRLGWNSRRDLTAPSESETALVIDVTGFPPEGDDSAARWIVRGFGQGWPRIMVYGWHGGRFAGSGIGPSSQGKRLDLYGDVGDYTASGLDGADVHLHGDGQDQLGQIMRRGKLVIHGDAGQTFLYGAKGGEIYVRGSAAGRPLINAVGSPRVVINGTCLDYLAESFMAGDPFQGGGFVILNGIEIGEDGRILDLPSPYPGGNLFSLASGGAIYVRDPLCQIDTDQLNGGAFLPLAEADWDLILPYLEENERLFGIRVDDLLSVEGKHLPVHEVYRKIGIEEKNELLLERENR